MGGRAFPKVGTEVYESPEGWRVFFMPSGRTVGQSFVTRKDGVGGAGYWRKAPPHRTREMVADALQQMKPVNYRGDILHEYRPDGADWRVRVWDTGEVTVDEFCEGRRELADGGVMVDYWRNVSHPGRRMSYVRRAKLGLPVGAIKGNWNSDFDPMNPQGETLAEHMNRVRAAVLAKEQPIPREPAPKVPGPVVAEVAYDPKTGKVDVEWLPQPPKM